MTARVEAAWEKSTTAETYERHLVPLLFEPWARTLVEELGPRPGERVLDLACGTGVVARLVAPLVGPTGRVTGIDLSADMLRLARRHTPQGGAPITWKPADALDTGLPDAAVDVAFCQQGLQFFLDRLTALRELHRVTAPGGRRSRS